MQKISQSEMALLLQVSQPTISEALKNKHLCKGVDLSSCAHYGKNGRFSHFLIPVGSKLGVIEESEMGDIRENPIPLNWLDLIRKEDKKDSPTIEPVVPQQDYYRPAAAVSSGAVVMKALENDRPMNHATLAVNLIVTGAMVGYEVARNNRNDNGTLGALIGVGIVSVLLAKYLPTQKTEIKSNPTHFNTVQDRHMIPSKSNIEEGLPLYSHYYLTSRLI